ncbi:MAG: carboxypeptidase regulatory-like domain-containing protein [bacterium]|nr:carboxypeptidase regulatory-like domain-containing protein [bacterium]
MNGKILGVILGGLVAAGLVALLVLGGEKGLSNGGPGSADGDGDTEAGSLPDGDEGLDEGLGEGVETASAADGRAVLFGTEGAHLKGPGDLIGQVMDFATHEPVTGCSVRLTGRAFNKSPVDVSVSAGKEGRFQFREIPAGRDFKLVVLVNDAPVRTRAGVSLAASDVVDVGVLYVGGDGRIEGIVLGDGDQPVVGAEVQIMPGGLSMEEMLMDMGKLFESLDQDPPAHAETKTDTKGKFTTESVPPGSITVVVRAPGYSQALRPSLATPTGASGGLITIRLRTAPAIKGQVVDAAGVGVGGARIALMDQSDSETGFFARQFVETDAGGHFAVTSPPDATRLMAIVAAAGYPTLVEQVDPAKGAVRLVLRGGATLTIHMISSDTGESIEGAHISAMFSDTNRMGGDGGNLVTGVTDARGRVELQARPGYMPMMFFRHDEIGTNVFMPQMSMGGAGQAMTAFIQGPKEVKLVKGSNKVELRVPVGMTIKGRVTDANGAPIESVQMGVAGFGLGGGARAVTDADGLYELTGVLRMPALMMQAKRSGYVQDLRSQTLMIGNDSSNEITHDMTMRRAASVEGRVVDATGKGIAGAEVRLESVTEGNDPMMGMIRGGAMKAITNGQGTYRVDTVMPDAEYRALARADGFVVAVGTQFRVVGAKHTDAGPVVLGRGVELILEVIGPTGTSIEGADVDVHFEAKDGIHFSPMDQWRSFSRGKTDGQGRYVIRDLSNGKVTATVTHDEYAVARGIRVIDPAQRDDSNLQLRMQKGQLMRGVVLDDSRRPVAGARVSVTASSRGDDPRQTVVPSQAATSLDDGSFVLRGIATDVELRVHVYAEGYRLLNQVLEPPYGDIRLEIIQVDPAIQARIDAANEELMGLYRQIGEAKTDTERTELSKRLAELQADLSRLRQDASGVATEAAPSEDR